MIFLCQKLQTNTMKNRISQCQVCPAYSFNKLRSSDTVQHHVQTLVPGETGKVESNLGGINICRWARKG